MKRLVSITLVLLMLVSMLVGCGAKEAASAPAEPMAAPAATEAAMEEVLYDAVASDAENGSVAMPMDQKLIRTVRMSAETLDMNPLMNWIDNQVAALGGYFEQKSTWRNGSRDDGSYYMFADLVIRIPAENLDQFLSQVGEKANVTGTSESTENVTLTYVSTKSRVEALEVEQQRLLELLENAETMEDLLTIEERLTDVRWELENYASQLRVLDNQVNYSTVYLDIYEVSQPTVMEERTVWQKIGDGFAENTIDLWDGVVAVFIWLLSSLPYLIPLALVAVFGFKFGKKLRAKKAKKQEEPKE